MNVPKFAKLMMVLTFFRFLIPGFWKEHLHIVHFHWMSYTVEVWTSATIACYSCCFLGCRHTIKCIEFYPPFKNNCRANIILDINCGASWSSSLIGHVLDLTAPRVGGSNPSSSFIRFPNQSREEAFVTRRNEMDPQRREMASTGVANQRRRTGRRFQDWSRERHSVRFADD